MQGKCILLTYLTLSVWCKEVKMEYTFIKKLPLSYRLKYRDHIKSLNNGYYTNSSHFQLVPNEIIRKVYEGSNVVHGEVPFQVHITIRDGEKTYLCGGAILNKHWVVTASHCIVKDNYNDPYCNDPDICYASSSSLFSAAALQVTAGESNLRHDDGTEQTRMVQLLVAHPNYNTDYLLNDIALLRVDVPFTLSEHVNKIPLATELPTSQDNVTVSGWGITEKGSTSHTLKYANYAVPTHSECTFRYDSLIAEGMWCSGNDDMRKHTGSGDSGGPVFQYINNSPYLVGVTSWGPSGTVVETGDYDVNTNIPYYTNWILQHIESDSQKKLKVTNKTKLFTWENAAQPFKYNRLKLRCHLPDCFIVVSITTLQFDNDHDAYITMYDSNNNTIPSIDVTPPLVEIRYNSKLKGVYKSSSDGMLIEIASGGQARNISCTISYRYDTYQCTDVLKRCDQVNDCEDWSDEFGCEYKDNSSMSFYTIGCYSTDFLCGNGHCTRRSLLCDGYKDCLDGSDEMWTVCSGVSSFSLNLVLFLYVGHWLIGIIHKCFY